MITTASPASNPRAMSVRLRAWMMSLPRPGAPTMLAMTAIDRASMMIWLMPAMIDGIARGSWI